MGGRCKHLVWLGVAVVVALNSACRPSESDAVDARVQLETEPSPPAVGQTKLTLTLSDANGQPLDGADVRVEGNMNHAGMKPSFADLSETDAGRYAGTIDFTMGGDWFLLINAKLPDGRTVEHKLDVPGVKAE